MKFFFKKKSQEHMMYILPDAISACEQDQQFPQYISESAARRLGNTQAMCHSCQVRHIRAPFLRFLQFRPS